MSILHILFEIKYLKSFIKFNQFLSRQWSNDNRDIFFLLFSNPSERNQELPVFRKSETCATCKMEYRFQYLFIKKAYIIILYLFVLNLYEF